MPVTLFNSSPLDIQPRIVRQPVDPLERQIREAQLKNLLEEGNFRQRQLNLQALGLEHSHENDLAMRKLQEAGLLNQTNQVTETGRHNKADELVNTGNLAETTRYHNLLATESQDRIKGELTSSMISHLDPMEQQPNVIARLLSLRGQPEYEQALGEVGLKKTGGQAELAMKMLAEPDKKTATSTEGLPYPTTSGVLAGLLGPIGAGYLALKGRDLVKKKQQRNYSALLP